MYLWLSSDCHVHIKNLFETITVSLFPYMLVTSKVMHTSLFLAPDFETAMGKYDNKQNKQTHIEMSVSIIVLGYIQWLNRWGSRVPPSPEIFHREIFGD